VGGLPIDPLDLLHVPQEHLPEDRLPHLEGQPPLEIGLGVGSPLDPIQAQLPPILVEADLGEIDLGDHVLVPLDDADLHRHPLAVLTELDRIEGDHHIQVAEGPAVGPEGIQVLVEDHLPVDPRLEDPQPGPLLRLHPVLEIGGRDVIVPLEGDRLHLDARTLFQDETDSHPRAQGLDLVGDGGEQIPLLQVLLLDALLVHLHEVVAEERPLLCLEQILQVIPRDPLPAAESNPAHLVSIADVEDHLDLVAVGGPLPLGGDRQELPQFRQPLDVLVQHRLRERLPRPSPDLRQEEGIRDATVADELHLGDQPSLLGGKRRGREACEEHRQAENGGRGHRWSFRVRIPSFERLLPLLPG
jgi:hypothetical protein